MFGFDSSHVPEIDVKKAFEDIKSGKDIVILDVRTPQEISRGSIKGSINIPLQELEDVVEKEIPDKNKTIYVYCLSGSRSVVAVDFMQKTGYKKVFNMTNGLLAWRSNQFPLEINNT